MKKFLGLCLVFMIISGNAAAIRAQEVTAKAATAAGVVRLSNDGPDRILTLKQQEIFRGSSYLSMYRLIKAKTYDAIIMRDFREPIYCPPVFYIITFRKKQSAEVFPPLPHCDGRPETAVDGDRILIKFRKLVTSPQETWVFDGLTLERKEGGENNG